MNTSELASLLAHQGNGAKLRESIQSSMPEFLRGLAERGRSAPVLIQEKGKPVLLGREHVCNLCTWYLNELITARELEYVASILDLSEDFQCDDEVREAIFDLGDPEVNGEITNRSVQSIIARLRGAP